MQTPASEAVIVVDDLVRRFGDHAAVDHLSFEVRRGSVCALLGRNGAGKTTVIKMLTTLLPPTAGHARICGYDVVREATRVRRVIGYVPQAVSADAELTGYENLLVMARLYDLPSRSCDGRIRAALDLMGLADDAHRLVRTYSGGMIRRLEIAQSTLHEPRVLFLDEPTVGLDPLARRTIWEHVARLRARGDCTILLTTHHMDEAEQLCDRIVILHEGRLAAAGTPADLETSIGPRASLDEVFAHFTQAEPEAAGAYDETGRTRRLSGRLG